MKRNKNKLTIGIICGGPSEERGISLNSARSVLDHLHGDGVEVVPFYLDYKARPYKLKRSQMYSNTPSDFDFKLHNSAVSLSKKEFINELKELDIVLPVLHGTYGEDGTIQQLLEKNNIPYIGSSSLSCRRAFDKYSARSELANNGFVTISAIVLEKKDTTHSKIINTFHRKVSAPRYIVKPARGGSSIGVYSVTTKKEILNAAQNIFDANLDSRVIVEPFIEGTEFTLSILENKYGLPVALIPTEIETSYANNEVFDYRKKYLPTNAARHHTPPRFSKDVIDSIRTQGEHIFALLEMSSFARFDGWVLSDGTVVFTDLNPFNGMEQNSFMFQQGARIGMSHADMLHVLLRVACAKYGLTYPYRKKSLAVEGKNVPVLFGGSTSERQVSVMSGTNAWLKLR